MRIVLQRVSSAEVRISGRVAGRISQGLLVLVAFREGDGEEQVRWMAEKIRALRLFADADGKMNLGLDEIGGGLLIVSQFTLYGNARKGRRPSFIAAARPETAIPLYNRFLEVLRERAPGPVESGEFGAMMDVELVNDGPVTLVLDR